MLGCLSRISSARSPQIGDPQVPMTLEHPQCGFAAPGLILRQRFQIGAFRPIRVDHTNCLQVAIKTHSLWGPTLDTLAKIQASCNSQTHLEEANVFTPTRHLLLAIKQLWKINRVHGLPAVTAPAFFTSASKGNERW